MTLVSRSSAVSYTHLMDASHFPAEDEQAEQYEKVLRAFGQRPVVLRTLDLGADKTLRYFQLPRAGLSSLSRGTHSVCLSAPMSRVRITTRRPSIFSKTDLYA